MISCQNLDKSFSTSLLADRKFNALKNISFELSPGTTCALVGPNGSGKTTLLSCLLGLYHPSQGKLSIEGNSPQNPESKKNTGYLPEHFSTYPNVTPIQAIQYYSRLSGHNPSQSSIDHWLKRLDIDAHQHRNIGSFSKGMVQRLGIIISLIHNPNIIIWDEPSSGLDPEGRKLVLDLIEEEKNNDKTWIISTHILSDIERTCDHVLILRKGQLLLNQNIAQACQDHQCADVESLYLKIIHQETV